MWRRALAVARGGPWGRAVPAVGGALPEGVPAAGLTLKTLKAHPHGLDLGPLLPRLPERLFTADKRVKLVHDLYVADLERLRTRRNERPDARNGLVLIGRRHLRSINSWMHNSRRLVKGKSRCTLMIHPADAADRGLEQGATAVVSSRAGEVQLPVEITEALMPGVVSIPHAGPITATGSAAVRPRHTRASAQTTSPTSGTWIAYPEPRPSTTSP